MLHQLKLIICICTAAIIFASCGKEPDHVKYIPKDALMVTGINTKELGKSIAWNVITGSKLFKEMQNEMKNKKASDLGDAGIKGMSTSYVYLKKDARFANSVKITGIIPLSDAAKWEAYVKKAFPEAVIKEVNKRKEANLGNGVYVGWTNDLLIGMNSGMAMDETSFLQEEAAKEDWSDTAVAVSDTVQAVDPQMTPSAKTSTEDDAILSAEINSAFTVSKENSLVQDKRYKDLAGSGHDITVWVNYEIAMGEMMNNMPGMAAGISLPSSLWKGLALAAGIDFEKGKIAGDLKYYMSDDFKEIAKEFGAETANKKMTEALPSDNLNLLMTMHLNPKAIKTSLEKTGMLGLINIGLAQTGLSIDDILESFNGDMVLSLNNFSMQEKTISYPMGDTSYSYTSNEPDMDFIYALKIGNQEKFNKLFNYLIAQGVATKLSENSYVVGGRDSIFLLKDNDLVVVSSGIEMGQNYLQKKFKQQELPEHVKDHVFGHPFGVYVNIQSIFTSVQNNSKSGKDSLAIEEARKLMENAIVSGGAYKDGASTYQFELNFINKDENSLIQLMDFGMKMKETMEKEEKQPEEAVSLVK